MAEAADIVFEAFEALEAGVYDLVAAYFASDVVEGVGGFGRGTIFGLLCP